jgi:hypothetical protein
MDNQRKAPLRQILKSGTIILGKKTHVPCSVRNLSETGAGRSLNNPDTVRHPPFMYHCPNTGRRIQEFIAEEMSGNDTYEAVTCIVCQQVHLVNAATAKVLGQNDIE